MNICESLTVTAKLLPDQTAIIYGDTQLSYRQLNGLSVSAAERLTACGIKPGDRVALMLPNAPAFPIWYYAALRIGAIVVSVGTRLAPSEVNFVVNDCEVKAFVASDTAFDTVSSDLPDFVSVSIAVDDASGNPITSTQSISSLSSRSEANQWHQAEPDDPALILYTSGTTGFPKGATLSHANVRSNVHAFNHLCKMQSHDRVLLAVPLFHCFGQNALLNSVLNVGGTIVLQKRFDLNESKRLISENRITQLYGVPMMFGLMLESCSLSDLESINYCFSAAATLPIQTGTAWREKFGMPIYEGYGLTETSPFASYNHRLKFVPGSIGMPIDSVEVRITDTQTGETCQPRQLGEIAIRGPNVMLGYWNRPEETANAIRNGWFHSGDIGHIDEDGYLFIVDRVKDMITIGGLKVFPAEVERVLIDHPSVTQAAVVGVPDPVFGEQVIAYLVLDSNADAHSEIPKIEHHAKSNLGNYKVPRRLVVVEELPRNPSGKVLKTRLREMAVENLRSPEVGSNGAGVPAVAANLKPATLRDSLAATYESEKSCVAIAFLQAQIQEICELEEKSNSNDSFPNPDDSFIEAGLDSLAIVELSAQLQVEVGPQVALPPTLLFDYPRIVDLANFLVTTIDGDSNSELTQRQKIIIDDKNPSQAQKIQSEVEHMSEEQALAELMKELE
jgi:long-chain acyl-CoA synthetase